MNLGAIQMAVHENAKAHGWWEEERTFGELIALCHTELSEAFEEIRKGKTPWETYYSHKDESGVEKFYANNPTGEFKPEGVPAELADCVIRILDMCEHYEIDLEKVILEKHKYNQKRPYKHGGKTL